jgi:hypothetical protein
MEIYVKRLVKGILYTGIGAYTACHEYGTNWLGSNNRWRDSIAKWAENQSDFVSWMASFSVFLMTFIALALLAKGIYYLYTMHLEEVPAIDTTFAEKMRTPCTRHNSGGDNIEKFKQYRDAKLSAMSNYAAAEEYKKTAWVDSLGSDNGRHTQSARRYINSQLASKTNEQGYNWLKR